MRQSDTKRGLKRTMTQWTFKVVACSFSGVNSCQNIVTKVIIFILSLIGVHFYGTQLASLQGICHYQAPILFSFVICFNQAYGKECIYKMFLSLLEGNTFGGSS